MGLEESWIILIAPSSHRADLKKKEMRTSIAAAFAATTITVLSKRSLASVSGRRGAGLIQTRRGVESVMVGGPRPHCR